MTGEELPEEGVIVVVRPEFEAGRLVLKVNERRAEQVFAGKNRHPSTVQFGWPKMAAVKQHLSNRYPGVSFSVTWDASPENFGNLVLQRSPVRRANCFTWDMCKLKHVTNSTTHYPWVNEAPEFVLQPLLYSQEYYDRSPLMLADHLDNLTWLLFCVRP